MIECPHCDKMMPFFNKRFPHPTKGYEYFVYATCIDCGIVYGPHQSSETLKKELEREKDYE